MNVATHQVAQHVPDMTPDRSADGRLMYYEHQAQRSQFYKGLFDDWPIEEVRVLLDEMLPFLGVHIELPLPPAGLPGLLHAKYDRNEPAAELISIGLDYLAAIISNERKSMHFRWREARDFIRRIERNATESLEAQILAAEVERAETRIAQVEAVPQLVYFIGAQSGPIKIGIAGNVQNRLKGLQTGHHEKLELLATCEGGQSLERDYHKRFASRRLNGEWFERCPEIEGEIERLSA
jgi:hypothetical protein